MGTHTKATPPARGDSGETTGVRFILRALRHRNFRLFFGGQGISLVGTWMQQIAMSWLVYRLTDSAFFLGAVGFASQIPSLLMAPFAGVLVDRWNRRRIILATQALAMVHALLLAALTLTHTIAPWHIIVLGVFLGFVNALDIPARQSFLVEMVEKKEDLGNAIALNSSMFNSARLIGPSIAGMLIPLVGEGMCFLFNGLSYLAVLAALAAIRTKPRQKDTVDAAFFTGFKEGVSYVAGFPPIKTILLLLALISLVGTPYTVLLPVFAKEILHGGPHTLGFLVAAMGTGALVGALYLASRHTVLGLGRKIALAAGAFGVGLILLAQAHVLWLALLLMLITGFGMIVQMASSNTIVQTLVDDDKRGRVMSLYSLSFMGTAPLGSLLAGSLASKLGVPYTFMLGGCACILGACWFSRKLPALRERARPIYIRLGILPAPR